MSIFLTLILPFTAKAAGGSDGGGNAVGKKLLDLYENEGSQKIDPKTLAVFKEKISPLLKKIADLTPEFEAFLSSETERKDWYMEPKPLGSSGCKNSSMISVKTTIVGCQNNNEVRIYEPWFKSADQKNQTALILHEMLLSVARTQDDLDKETIENNVRALNRILLADKLPNENELASIVKKYLNFITQTKTEYELDRTVKALEKKFDEIKEEAFNKRSSSGSWGQCISSQSNERAVIMQKIAQHQAAIEKFGQDNGGIDRYWSLQLLLREVNADYEICREANDKFKPTGIAQDAVTEEDNHEASSTSAQ